MRPPDWVWVVLAAPTIASLAAVACFVVLAVLREAAWRRRRARRHRADVIQLRRPADRDATPWNGGAPRPPS